MKAHILRVSFVIMIGLLIYNYQTVVQADPGDIDLTFGTNGVVKTDIGGFDAPVGIVTQNDGKILVSGMTFGPTNDFVVVRYEEDGSLDNSFGTGGIVITNMSDSDFGRKIILQADEKMIVGGSSKLNGNTDFALVRYNPDGSIDSSFGNSGVVVTPLTENVDEIWDIDLQTDDKILAVGESNGQFTLARYTNAGSLDLEFGEDGLVMPLNGRATGVVEQTDGKIIAVGSSSDNFAIIRLNVDGTVDSSFGSGGIVILDNGIMEVATDVAVQDDGKLVVVGTAGADGGSNLNMVVARLNIDGSIDTSFGVDGLVIYDSGSDWDQGSSLAIQPDGKILAAGENPTFVVLSLLSDGSFDTTFSGDGIAVSGSGQTNGMTVQDDNKIVLTGNGNGDFVTVRFDGASVTVSQRTAYLPAITRP